MGAATFLGQADRSTLSGVGVDAGLTDRRPQRHRCGRDHPSAERTAEPSQARGVPAAKQRTQTHGHGGGVSSRRYW